VTRIRDINLQTISDEGIKCKVTFATIEQMAKKKMKLNNYQYIYDRIIKKYEMIVATLKPATNSILIIIIHYRACCQQSLAKRR